MNKKNRKRNLLAATLTAALLTAPMALSLPAGQAAAAKASPILKTTATPFSIEGKRTSIATIHKDNSTYIALRSLNASLGLSTTYEKAADTVKITGRDRVLQIGLKDSSFKLNGQPIYNGSEAIVQNNTTYLPLRVLLEQMGYAVSYEQASKMIGIHAVQENKLKIGTEAIASEEDGKSIHVYYPVLSGYSDTAVQNKINAFLKKEADRNVAEGSKEMDPQAKENMKILAGNPKADVRTPSLDGQYTVSYNEKGKLSLYVDYYVYTGGAHGMTVRQPYTFDLATGDVLSLKEAAGGKENYVSAINKEIKDQIKNRHMDLMVPFQTIEADRDYFLNRNGIVIYFTQYEYTSYAEGMPEFVIPYSAFK